eukprot:359517-Chlamydomonas_euryale.AAC.36
MTFDVHAPPRVYSTTTVQQQQYYGDGMSSKMGPHYDKQHTTSLPRHARTYKRRVVRPHSGPWLLRDYLEGVSPGTCTPETLRELFSSPGSSTPETLRELFSSRSAAIECAINDASSTRALRAPSVSTSRPLRNTRTPTRRARLTASSASEPPALLQTRGVPMRGSVAPLLLLPPPDMPLPQLPGVPSPPPPDVPSPQPPCVLRSPSWDEPHLVPAANLPSPEHDTTAPPGITASSRRNVRPSDSRGSSKLRSGRQVWPGVAPLGVGMVPDMRPGVGAGH